MTTDIKRALLAVAQANRAKNIKTSMTEDEFKKLVAEKLAKLPEPGELPNRPVVGEWKGGQ